MPTLKLVLFLLTFIGFYSGNAQQILYVSPNGSDANNGDRGHPLESISTALKKVNPSADSCIIIVKEGTYPITETIQIAGKHNICIRAEEGANVVLDGSLHIPVSEISSLSHGEFVLPASHHTNFKHYVSLSNIENLDWGSLRQVGYERAVKPCWPEVILNDKIMHLSRWPNQGFIPLGEVLDKGSTYKDKGTRNGGVFYYQDDEMDCLSEESDLWLSGYFNTGWAEDAVRVKAIDTINNTISTEHASYYGFEAKHSYNRWYAYNVLNKLDEEGEYYIDRNTGKLAFFSRSVPVSLRITQLNKPFIIIRNSTNIELHGIRFDGGRDRGVLVRNSELIFLNQCQFLNLGSYAVLIDEGCTRCEISNSLIKDVGVGGVLLKGGVRATLKPGMNKVTHCTITNFNRIDGGYRPAVSIEGVGNSVSYCEISEAPNMGIMLQGNEHRITNNYFHHLCQTVHDQGVIYYGRDPSERGHIVKRNYFYQNSSERTTVGVYCDDGACGMDITENIFISAAQFSVMIGGGSQINLTDNLFAQAPYGIYIDNRLETRSKHWLQPGGIFTKKMAKVNYTQAPYSDRYEGIDNYFKHQGKPHDIIVDSNVFLNIDHIIDGDSTLLFWLNNLMYTDSLKQIQPGSESLKEFLHWQMPDLHSIGYPGR